VQNVIVLQHMFKKYQIVEIDRFYKRVNIFIYCKILKHI